jgi:nicotinamide-nucleotide amidase
VKAEVLTIGDELLRGEIVDSNKSFLSQRLLTLDIETRFHASVLDDRADMADAFRRAAARSDIVLVSGGLGPTRDDLTIEVLAETFGRKLVLDEASLEEIRSFFRRFGREMAEINAKQALFPEGAEVLPNPIGTAPGTMLEVARAELEARPAQRAEGERSQQQGKTLFFCMPGVPRELYKMMDEQVLPRIAARRRATSFARAALLRTFGIGESNLDERLRDLELPLGVELGFRTNFPDNYVRPVARAASEAEAQAKLERACAAIRAQLGPLVYGEGEAETLEAVVGRMLAERGQSVAAGESCTGGMIAELLTAVPGSSGYFRGGVVAYSNAAKTALLGVPAALLEQHGAVSEPVARAMAEGVRERFAVDYAVATTGIAGPSGGTPEKPVGLVYVALASATATEVRELVFTFDRERNRRVTAQVALDWVRRQLLGEPLDLPTASAGKAGARSEAKPREGQQAGRVEGKRP